MPKTFIDAVTITRRLGLRYLWIDSLCICQDDTEDWARESGLMADVYSNAHVVIAANRSTDCTGGCFHERAPREEARIQVPIMGSMEYIHMTRLFPSDHCDWPDDSFSTEPLSERGWALQERIMAQRTLHYNNRQLYFECFHGLEAEDGYIQSVTKSYRYQHLSTPEPPIWKWYCLVEEFGKRKLSRARDKLPAMSGLAKKFQEAIGADYVAGLWSNELVHGMAWQCCGERTPASLEEYTGPSWSWASYGGTASYSKSPDWVAAQVLDWHVELKEEANPFGEVTDAWISIRGPVARLNPWSWSSEGNSAEDEWAAVMAGFTRVSVSATVEEGWHILQLDNQSWEESGEWRNWDLRVMLLCGRFGEEGLELVEGIVFREATRADQRGKMERVGYMDFMGCNVDWVLGQVNLMDWMAITLV